ncbi:MAG: hemolysin family protein [Ornithinimicrobium sp.]
MSIGVEILVVVLLVLANGVFAMAEMALVSAREIRLRTLAEGGDAGATAALNLVDEPSRFLSTVQVGISLIAIVLGAFGGATLSDDLAGPLAQIDVLEPYAQPLAFVIVVLIITFVSLVLGELVPKRLALHNPERIASLVSRPMRVVSKVAGPVVWVLSASTDAVVRLFGVTSSTDEPDVTEEEIRKLLEQAASSGAVKPEERDLVEKVFRVGDRRIDSLMTPRPQITWMNVNDPPADTWTQMSHSGHSEFPLCDGTLDDVLGLVSIKRLWLQAMNGDQPDPRAAMRTAPLVPESIPALKVLEVFRQSGSHVALVVDEYGDTQGLVTPVDVLEAIAGDLPSVDQPTDPRVTRNEDGSWLLDGGVSADMLFETLGLSGMPEEDRGEYKTVAGFVITHLQRLPEPGERFDYENFTVEIRAVDGNRVSKVRVSRQPERSGDESAIDEVEA